MNRRREIGIALGIIVIITTGCIWYMVSAQQKEVKVFTATLAFPGSELEADNYMEDKIAELTGARAEVTWLNGQNPSDLVNSMIVSGEYPDYSPEYSDQRGGNTDAQCGGAADNEESVGDGGRD
mgnify:CR=1 FL=1